MKTRHMEKQQPGTWIVPLFANDARRFGEQERQRRLVQDAKLLMAIDRHRHRSELNFEEYLMNAAQRIQQFSKDYAQAAQRAMKVNADRPR